MRTFLVVWFGQLVSQIGTAMSTFALLIWIYEHTGRATSVALLGFFWFLPVITLAPFAGVWIDRYDRAVTCRFCPDVDGTTLERRHVLSAGKRTRGPAADEAPAFFVLLRFFHEHAGVVLPG